MIPSLFTLGLALGPLWFYPRTTDQVLHLSLGLNCLFFLCISLFFAPHPLQLLILVGILSLSQTVLRSSCDG